MTIRYLYVIEIDTFKKISSFFSYLYLKVEYKILSSVLFFFSVGGSASLALICFYLYIYIYIYMKDDVPLIQQ
jgi:hypothetical protein